MVKVSIIVPIYNGEKHLNRCIDSLISQTFKDIEIICLDDGSSDNSLKILKNYEKKDRRIKVISKSNSGVSDTRNIGIKEARGDYICFCDCDDFVEKNMIEVLYNTIKKENVDVVRCNYKITYSNNNYEVGKVNNICNRIINKEEINDTILMKIVSGDLQSYVCLLLLKKEKLLKTSLFPSNIGMLEDMVLYIDLLTKIDSLYIIDRPLYNYMYVEDSITNSFYKYEKNIYSILMANKCIKDILNNYNIDINILKVLNTSNIVSISDYLFRGYIVRGNIKLLFNDIINNDILKDIFKNLDYSGINVQRRIIIKAIDKSKYNYMVIFMFFRKIIYNLKRGKL